MLIILLLGVIPSQLLWKEDAKEVRDLVPLITHSVNNSEYLQGTRQCRIWNYGSSPESVFKEHGV